MTSAVFGWGIIFLLIAITSNCALIFSHKETIKADQELKETIKKVKLNFKRRLENEYGTKN